MTAQLGRTIPALPVRDVPAAVAHYRERFGFDAPHVEGGFAIVRRDEAEIHLWAASDEEWRVRAELQERPICSGAESFIAGTASCRIDVQDVDALFDEAAAPSTAPRRAASPRRTSGRASSTRSTSTETC